MEKEINQLIIKELKKRIKNLEGEVNYLKGRLDQLTIPNLNIKPEKIKYPYIQGGDFNTPYFERCSCNPKNGGSGVCGCVNNSMTIIC